MVAPLGGVRVGRPRRGRHWSLQVQLPLPILQLLLFADLLPHPGFIQPHCADAVARRPEMQTAHSTLRQQLPMDPHSARPVQEAEDKRHAGLRWDAQAQVHVVGQRMPFQQLNATLTTQIPQDGPDLPPQPSVEDLPAIFRYDHDVALTVPTHRGQALPLVQRLLLPAPRGLPGRRSRCRSPAMARRIARSSTDLTARGHDIRRELRRLRSCPCSFVNNGLCSQSSL